LKSYRPGIKPDGLGNKGFFSSDFIYFSSFPHLTPAEGGYITCVVDALGVVAECAAAALRERKSINKIQRR
jgi:hypothetical protein